MSKKEDSLSYRVYQLEKVIERIDSYRLNQERRLYELEIYMLYLKGYKIGDEEKSANVYIDNVIDILERKKKSKTLQTYIPNNLENFFKED